jgi:hypothetical protein
MNDGPGTRRCDPDPLPQRRGHRTALPLVRDLSFIDNRLRYV